MRGANLRMYAAFGNFIKEFTVVDAMIHTLFRHCMGIDDDAARAIVGKMYVKDLMPRIKALIKIKKMPSTIPRKYHSEIKLMFSKYDEIHDFRNDLVHKLAIVGENEWISTDEMTTNSLVATTIKSNIADIEKAINDLHIIHMKLLVLVNPTRNDDFFQNLRRHYESYTFLYKPPKREKKPRKR